MRKAAMAAVATISMIATSTAENTRRSMALTKDGHPAASIILNSRPTRSAQFAAAELQYHIEKITGATLPVSTDAATASGTRIFVGENESIREKGLNNKDFSSQEYLVGFRDQVIILMGRDRDDTGKLDYQDASTFPDDYDEQGTCYAVYDFLELYCGVRWYLPTELGMVYPARKNLSVDAGADIRRTPAAKYRNTSQFDSISETLSDTSGPLLPERERRLFARRWRVGGEPYASNHAFYRYYDTPRNLLKTHRDWFAKGYDTDAPSNLIEEWIQRRVSRRDMMKYYPNMCYTNKDFIQEVIDNARTFFDTGKRPPRLSVAAGNYVALGPMDSSGSDKFCQCPDCLPLLHEKPPLLEWRKQHFMWDDRYSDYVFSYTNRIAKAVAQTHPGKYVTQLAYHQNYYPPSFPLEPNVAVTLCVYEQLRAVPAVDRATIELFDKWDESVPDTRKVLWMYFHRPGSAGRPFFPGFMARKIVTQMADYHRRGIFGFFIEPNYLPREERKKNYSARGPNANLLEIYLVYKLAYDPGLDGNAMIDEFFQMFYGQAAKPMQELYEAIEEVYTNPVNYVDTYFGYQTERIAWGVLGTEERMTEFGRLMEAAKKSAVTETEKKRIKLFEDNIWEPMRQKGDEWRAKERKLSTLGEPLPSSVFGEWLFRKDVDNRGVEEGWYKKTVNEADGWVQVPVPAWLGSTDVGPYLGYGWYYTTLKIPESAAGKEVNLRFGAVDEQAWIYVNGTFAGEHTSEGMGVAPGALWNVPFSIKVSSEYINAGKENHLFVRIHAHAGASGIWDAVTAYIEAELLKNGDFEKTSFYEQGSRVRQNLESGDFILDDRLEIPDGWHVRAEAAASADGQREYRLITDSAKANSGSNFIFLRGIIRNTEHIPVSGGDELQVDFHVKDPDSKRVTARLYLYDEWRRFAGSVGASGLVTPGVEWTGQTGLFVVPEEIRGRKIRSAWLALGSRTGAYFDNVKLTPKKTVPVEWTGFEGD